MKKTFFEQRIERMADQRLDGEYNTLRSQLLNSPIGKNLKIGDDYLVYHNGMSDVIIRDYRSEVKNQNLKKLLDDRREQLISIITQEVMDKLSSIEYLFRNLEA